jgi:hypothetical protein
MWQVVPLEGATLDEVDSPRLVVDACPHCGRRARIIERAVLRPFEGQWPPWRATEVARKVLQCEKCGTCFALPDEGLPPWAEKPEAREKSLKLANLRARFTVCSREVARWRNRSDLAGRAGDVALAEEARRVAVRYEAEAHALRSEIERLGGELPSPPPPDAAEQKLDAELAAMREKAAAKKAAQDTAAPGEKSDEPPAPKSDEAPAEAPAEPERSGDALDDELAALKRKVGRKEPPAGDAKPAAQTPPSEDDEVAALKRRLKKNN